MLRARVRTTAYAAIRDTISVLASASPSCWNNAWAVHKGPGAQAADAASQLNHVKAVSAGEEQTKQCLSRQPKLDCSSIII